MTRMWPRRTAGSHRPAGRSSTALPAADSRLAGPGQTPSAFAEAPAGSEQALSELVQAPVALYVHFPFCLSICPYCDFVVQAGRAATGPESRIATFLDALRAEIELRGRPAQLASLYIGGGTPSLLSAVQLAQLLSAVDADFGLAADAEVTLEVNPGARDRGDLAGFAAAGINRISVGAQSMDQRELRALGRRHDPTDVAATVAAARSAGVLSISVDLLYDVPHQTLASWQQTLTRVLEIEPDHVSAYALTLDDHEPAADQLTPSAGARHWRARARVEQDDDRAADMYELADDVLARAGLAWYEISNFARPGHESRHNQAYWHSLPWEAVGPGAHAFDGRATRRWNDARLEGYLGSLAAGRLPPGGSMTDSMSTATAERLILGLRTAFGVSSEELLTPPFDTVLEWAKDASLLEASDGRVRLTRRGRLLSNEVFSRLWPAPAG